LVHVRVEVFVPATFCSEYHRVAIGDESIVITIDVSLAEEGEMRHRSRLFISAEINNLAQR
jgi:hypothetical protein